MLKIGDRVAIPSDGIGGKFVVPLQGSHGTVSELFQSRLYDEICARVELDTPVDVGGSSILKTIGAPCSYFRRIA